jgi:hypothetical protein
MVLSSTIIIEAWRKLISSDQIQAQYPFSDERDNILCLRLRSGFQKSAVRADLVNQRHQLHPLSVAHNVNARGVCLRPKETLNNSGRPIPGHAKSMAWASLRARWRLFSVFP